MDVEFSLQIWPMAAAKSAVILAATAALACRCHSSSPRPQMAIADAAQPDATAELVSSAADVAADGEFETLQADTVAGETAAEADGAPIPQANLCAGKNLKTWSRKTAPFGGIVAFNEIQYAAPSAAGQWIELHNALGIAVDLSGFRLAGDVTFTFADGTFVAADSYVLVAADPAAMAKANPAAQWSGPFAGQLAASGGNLTLLNNAGRVLDTLNFSDREPWPVAASGSGATLAKWRTDRNSSVAENWRASTHVGGTPGKANFATAGNHPAVAALVPMAAKWRYWAAAPPANWNAAGFDDSAWGQGTAPFFGGSAAAAATPAVANFTADNFLAVYAAKADGSELTYVGRDSAGDWTSAEKFALAVKPGHQLYVAAWEAPGNNGGPQALIGEVTLPDGSALATGPDSFEWVLGPKDACPGGALADPAPSTAQLAGLIAAANAAKSWAKPLAAAPKSSPPWGPALAGVFASDAQFIWADTFADVSVSNTANTYVLFRSKAPILPPKGTTQLAQWGTTTYFRTHFAAPTDLAWSAPWLDALADDGAVFYIDGQPVQSLRMPAGPVGPTTLAAEAVASAEIVSGLPVPATAVTAGEHVLAVELHQASAADADMAFAAALSAWVEPPPEAMVQSGLAFNEIAAGGAGFWLELVNLGDAPTECAGGVVASSSGGQYQLPAHTLPPGGVWLLTAAQLGFAVGAKTKLFLYAPEAGRVADAAAVAPWPRARTGHGGHDWANADATTPGSPNPQPTAPKVVLHEIMVRDFPLQAADGTATKSPLEWIELRNAGTQAVDLGGWQLADAVEYTFAPGTALPAGGYVVVANDTAAMLAAYPTLTSAPAAQVVGNFSGGLSDSGENLLLRDACGNQVDAVRYFTERPWPDTAHGGGSSLELRDARANRGSGQAWAPSDEAPKAQWQTITYQGVAAPSSVGPDGQYHELVVGLLDAGTAWIDDISVVEDPDGAAVELVENGNFETGSAAPWRLLGNHRHSEVAADPTNPANHALHLQATGPSEHMHNHAEITLLKGHPLANGKTYRIKLRARWQSGSNQLNTRLYFNRLAKTHLLKVPAARGTPGAANSQAVANLGPTFSELRHAPAVPQPLAPVRVSVQAADPDGVAAVTLTVVTNDGAPQSWPMVAQGGGRYAVVVPGAAAGAVRQFYVTGTDALGQAATFPAGGPQSRALWRVASEPPALPGLHTLRIILTPADTQWLFDAKNLMSNDRIGATIIDGESEAYYDVGLRLKGSERGRPETVRVGFALRFSPDHLFRGVYSDCMVDRSEGVSFGQRELFFNQAMNRAGSVHSQYDDLTHLFAPLPKLTGSAQLQLARFGDLLLDAQFANGGDGGVFEYELIYVPSTTDTGTPQGNKLPLPDNVFGIPVTDLGPDKEAYRLSYILKSNRWRDPYAPLMKFAKALGQAGSANAADVAASIDVDQWLRAFAFATLSGAIDNYASGSQHNGNFYVRPADNRVLYFPHDLDFYGGSPHSPLVACPDLAKLVGDPANLRNYYSHLYDIVTTAYNAKYMAGWAGQFAKLAPAQNWAGHLQFIDERAQWVLSGAPNAVTKAIAPLPFQIAGAGGAPLAASAPEFTLTGQGWVDVFTARNSATGEIVALKWLGLTAWQAQLPVACGANNLPLQALDRHGAVVGSSAVTVVRTGAGCP